jgi:peptidoglycan hydrolase-like protein with peptidoglycan-binding domain
MRPSGTIAALVAVSATLVLAEPATAITNPQVPGLQVALKAKGLYTGEVDGIAGPLTARAVRRFQRRAGLVVDGIPGPLTRRALGRLGRPLFGKRMLIHRGMLGWDVAVLEFFLARRGVSPGRVDGRFARRTEQAVRRYQRQRKLAVDGIAGPQTLRTFGARPAHAHGKPAVSSTRRSVRRSLSFWARHYGVSRSLVFALAWQESGFQPNARSSAGAWGVLQVTPSTWQYVETVLIGRRVPRTMDGGVRVGVAYLHQHLHEFDFRERRAIGAYFQGAWAVRRYGFFPETRAFVANVLALRRRFAA